jgi:hypothetical protein
MYIFFSPLWFDASASLFPVLGVHVFVHVCVCMCVCALASLSLFYPLLFFLLTSPSPLTRTHIVKKKSRCSLYSRRTPLRSSIRGQEECSKAKLSSPLFSPCYFSTCLLPECVLPSPPHCFPSLLLLKSPTEQKQDNNINRAKSAAAPTQKNGPGNYGRPV